MHRRHLTTAGLIGTCLVGLALGGGCTSSSTSGSSMRMLMSDYEVTWAAALQAVDDIGGERRLADRSSGTIEARLVTPEAGGTTSLSIRVSRSSLDPNLQSGTDIRVSAKAPPGLPEDEAERRSELRQIEELYLDAVDAAIVDQQRRRRNPLR